jgi:two-component system LytT family response regulator
MRYKCIIVDDEPLARELIASHLTHFANLELCGSFENAIQASEFMKLHKTDLLFLDIEMPLIRGNEFIKKLAHLPKVIITTAYREYALEGYELNVTDYLLKPITFERFFRSIEKFRAEVQLVSPIPSDPPVQNDYLFVPSGNKNIRIVYAETLFIESFRDYISIHFSNGTLIHLKLSISSIEASLPLYFRRIHRSFIVNLNHLKSFSKNEVEINGRQFPVGESYVSVWNETITELSSKKMEKKR